MQLRGPDVVSYHIQQRLLPFPPPMAAIASNPRGLEYSWRLLHYSFELPNPLSARRAGVALSDESAAVVGRFVVKARPLAESPFLAHETSLTVQVRQENGRQVETITASPSRGE